MSQPPLDPYVPRHRDPGLAVSRYDLTLDYRVGRNRLDARAVLTARPTRPLDSVVLALEHLRATSVLIDGRKPARWSHKRGELVIRPSSTLAAGVPIEVSVEYSGAPRPRRGTWGEVGWEELTDGVIVAGQPDGAPSWFPCVDTPADKAAYRIAVTVDAPYMVVCNGTLVSRTARGSRVSWVYEQREPMAAYLATVQIGQYERREIASEPVRVETVAPPRLREATQGAFADLPRMIETFSELFGHYPFPAYGVVVTDDPLEIPLEAQGLATFGTNHLDGSWDNERLVAHELAHQWFGNSLTVRRWRDIWLHEGFACYAEWLWSERSGGRSAHDHAILHHARLAELPQDLVISDPGPELMFDDRLYKRGALALHALRLTLGDEAFFAALRAWVAEHRHGHVDTPGLLASLEASTGRSIAVLLAAWLDRPALPSLPPRAP